MKTDLVPQGIVAAGVDAVVNSYSAVLNGATDYWSGALDRRATPAELSLGLLTWATEVTRREKPQWASRNTVIAHWPIARLRDFSDEDLGEENSLEVVATLLLPPQAGHDSCIVDYDPHQSQVSTARQAGLTRVFALDWIGATDATKNAAIEDYLAVMSEAIDRLGGRVNLVGDCQGGWLAVIYAALYPQTVHTLTIAGAPVDFHAGEPLIGDWMEVLSPTRDLGFYRAMVNANGGMLPGSFLLAGFKTMQPDKEIDRPLQLLAHINEPDHVARYRTFETWFQHTQAIPGVFYLWLVEHLFQKNELVAGTLRVGETTVDLRRITCPVNLMAGTTDHITPAAQVFALADHVGTDPSDITRRLASGGHLGLFMGRDSLRNHWLPLFGEIAAQSRPPAAE